MKGEALAAGSGGFGRPYMRNYVGGGTGVFAPIHGFTQVAAGHLDTCLVVCEEKMSSCRPHPQAAFLSIFDTITERPLGPNLLWIFALEMNRWMHAYGVTLEEVAAVAVKNKRNALDHPSAQIAGEVTVEQVLQSDPVAWPVHRLMVSPTSDGAAAVVLAAEDVAKRITDRPVWIEGVGWNLDTAYWTNRDLKYPVYVENAARMAYNMAGVKNPWRDVDVWEPYDPFAYKELHHMAALLLLGPDRAREIVDITVAGRTRRAAEMPVTPSGGLLGVGNPIAAAGLMKVCELFWQLRGEAGRRQVDGPPRRGVAQAWGDLMQVGTVIVVGRDK
jgi:acetyl-CoA C-acetyltransferase